jgi:glycosyltransferase involved in cell wall biosynthesis
MKLSIIIPVYNEEKTISKVIDKLLKVKLPCRKEIIIVDDGSTDGTKEITKNQKLRTKNIKIIMHKHNQGKGAAIQSGIKKATGDYILIQDADLEYNPQEIHKLLNALKKGTRKDSVAVYGSRFIKDSATIPPLYLLGNKILTFITNILYGTRLTDMETGYKLVPVSFFKKIKLTSHRFDIEPEITIKLVKNKVRIIEVPISYKGRTHLGGKKLTVNDAFGALKTLLYLRFSR